MKKLFITSSFADVAIYFETFVGSSVRGKSVTFIITASITEEYTGYIDEARQAFTTMGIVVDELDISDKTQIEIAQKLANNDFIYVSGGNTFYLLQELKKTGVDNLLIEHIQNGKVFIGESAGSMILCPDISYVEQIDDKSVAQDLYDHKALCVVPFYVLPHYKSEPFTELIDRVYLDFRSKLPFVIISNTQVIEVNGDDFKTVGEVYALTK